jgi:hypothetical protein
MKNFKNNRGFIRIILLVVATLVLLKYVYKIDVVGFLTQGRFKELLDQFYKLGAEGWSKYRDVIIKVWNFIIELFKSLIAKIK